MNIVFGTWKIKESEVENVIACALKTGYRHFDTAEAYENDLSVGKALNRFIKQDLVTREELSISNKLWNTHRGYESTIKAFFDTLQRMSLEYLDSYLIHWPAVEAVDPDWQKTNLSTWKALEELHEDGYIRNIGLCNFKKHHIEALSVGMNIKPMINQIEFHPGWVQKETVDYCKSFGIELQAWSPLGNGKLLKKKVIKETAEKYRKSPAQICIKYCLEKEITPVTKTVKEVRMIENREVFNFEISAEDMIFLDQLPYMGGSGLDPDRPILFG